MVFYKRMEAWYERQTGQDRQSGTTESQNGDLMVFFLPLMQYGCYLKYYLSRLPWRFFVPNLSVFVCMDQAWDRIRR
ncbi:uncharacterized protein K441DRAFT_364614 [Cenococcum geophilum 1.58]|uniref:uncharacterized protein n=1 Tax=Cenococcum geophilum 1.58 TaxID=794803 RepID=UPI00358F0DFC|nr:hypothetical protein K441DRAFT_364614 [Cenococcum geophilum 1.58]